MPTIVSVAGSRMGSVSYGRSADGDALDIVAAD
jgi:hypothetical protein